jgi:glucose/arabinose dehydrogenase
VTFALEQSGKQKTHESHAADTDVWLTPPYILKALGPFDLDPCAPMTRPWDTAHKHFTKADGGLSQPWDGRVWLNPPYGAETAHWIKRLASHGDGVALIFARTETQAFCDWVWNAASSLLFLRGRVKFHYPDGRMCPTNAGAPSVLVAYGKRNDEALRLCGIDGKFIRI